MNSFTASAHGHLIGLWEFAIVLKLKNKKKFQQGNAVATNENVRTLRMCLYYSYWAFSFFHFSTTTLLQLGVCDL